MQFKHEEIVSMGGSLLSISPMLRQISAALVAKLGLDFPVLCDTGNVTAKQFGLVMTLSDSLKPIYTGFGIDIERSNGNDSFQLPLPATYIIDTERRVRFSFVDVDHTARLDPDVMMRELKDIVNPSRR